MGLPRPEIIEKIHSETSGFRVTGLAVQYAFMCEREAWFYLNGIDINREQSNISYGSMIDENTYGDSKKILIDGLISPDILEDGRVLEVKKSSISKDGAEKQLLYYLWYLEKFKDEKKDGVLAFPEERKRVEVELDDEKREELLVIIERLWELWNADSPPKFEKKPYCKACAYQDFCW